MSHYRVRVTDGMGAPRQVTITVQHWAYDILLKAKERNGSDTILAEDRGQMFFRKVRDVQLLGISRKWYHKAFAIAFARN